MMMQLADSLSSVEATNASLAANSSNSTSSTNLFKAPQFCVVEYKSTDGTTVQDYFTRFDWALQLSKVHMGSELNNSLKVLVSPNSPETLSYDEIKKTLVDHFDVKKNKYAESIKFRKIQQENDESIPNFVLRLKQAAAFCEYGDFLDRIEQLLYGLHSRIICDEIISKKPDKFSTAYDIAHTMELTRHTTGAMKEEEPLRANQELHRLGYSPIPTKHNKNKLQKERSTYSSSSSCF